MAHDDKADAEMFRFLCARATQTDYDGGWRSVWDIRGIEGYDGSAAPPYNHKTFRNAVKAAMKKEKKDGA